MERVMADPLQAASFRGELDAWDGTLLDGLQDLEAQELFRHSAPRYS
jgi:hypothetical protein